MTATPTFTPDTVDASPNGQLCAPILPVVRVQVIDDLDESTLIKLAEQLDDAVSLRPHELIVDLSACRYMDAQAIRVLMDTHVRVYTDGGRMILSGVGRAARRLLSIAGVDEVFTIQPLTDSTPVVPRRGVS